MQISRPRGTSNTSHTGVGGWLALLVFVLGVAAPAREVVEELVAIRAAEKTDPTLLTLSAWHSTIAVQWTAAILCTAMTVFAAWRLMTSEARSTIKTVIFILWLSGPILVLIDYLASVTVAHLPVGSPFVAVGAIIFQKSVFALVWSIYLLTSKRVEQTFWRSDAA